MNQSLVLFRVVTTKSVTLARRYIVNTVVGFVTLYVFFALIFFGGQFVAQDLISRAVGPLVVGYFLFTMAVSAYADLTHDLTEEAQWGTLEQLTMSPFGFTQIVTVKTMVNLGGTFVSGVVLLILMMLTTSTWLYIVPLTVIILGVLTLMPVVGLGFIFGGAALVYKQIEKVFPLVQLSFVGLIAMPVEEQALLKLLPMSLGSHLLQRVMTDGLRLWELPIGDLGLLVSKAVIYLDIGLLVFRFATAKARERGVLGHYKPNLRAVATRRHSCRDEIRIWSGDEEQGIENALSSEQTDLDGSWTERRIAAGTRNDRDVKPQRAEATNINGGTVEVQEPDSSPLVRPRDVRSRGFAWILRG